MKSTKRKTSIRINAGDLFEPKFGYELLCSKTRRVVYRQELTDTDAARWSERLEASQCGHLKWQKAGESGVKRYVVKR